MGKIRIRTIGLENVEKKQKQQAKKRAEKKKKKVKGVGLKGGERMVQVEVDSSQLKKEETARKIIDKKPQIVDSKDDKGKKIRRKKKKAEVSQGKKYLEAKKLIKKQKTASIQKAIKLLKKIAFAKFDESVELHINTNKPDLKNEVELPHGTGKKNKIRIVDDTFLEEMEDGKINFSDREKGIDVLISHPSYMPKLAKFARILGPKKLMPSSKTKTVSKKPEETAKYFNKGFIRWKTELKLPLIHQVVGKISFPDKDLEENIKVFIKSVGKGNIKDVFIKTTMSPSIKLEVDKL